jgi:hypothetical protein
MKNDAWDYNPPKVGRNGGKTTIFDVFLHLECVIDRLLPMGRKWHALGDGCLIEGFEMFGALVMICLAAVAISVFVRFLRRHFSGQYPKLPAPPGAITRRRVGLLKRMRYWRADWEKASSMRKAWRVYIGGAAFCLFLMLGHVLILGVLAEEVMLYEALLVVTVVPLMVLFVLIGCGWVVRTTLQDGGWVSPWPFRFSVEQERRSRN